MYKLCKTEQSALRQRELEQGLLELMQQRRYEDISVSDLCIHLQIPRKSFYRYFSSKDGALYALIDHTLMEFDGFILAARIGEKRTLQSDLEGFFQFWKERRSLLDALSKSGMTGVLLERAVDYVHKTAFPSRFLPGEGRWEQEHVVNFTICGLMIMMVNWYHADFADSVRDLAGVAVRMITRPLLPNVNTLL